MLLPRVALLAASAAVGGAERVLLDLAAALREAEPAWRPDVVVPGPGPLAEAAAAAGARVHLLALPSPLDRLGDAGAAPAAVRLAAALPAAAAHLLRLRRLLAALRPALVHTHGMKVHLLGALAAPPGARVLWHLHDFAGARPLAGRLLGLASRRAAAAAAVSAAVAEDARAVCGAGLDVRVVHDGIDLGRFRPEGAALDLDAVAGLAPAPAGTVRVGLVATLGLWKGHEVFLRALAALPPGLPVRGYLVGGGIYRTAGSEVSLAELRALSATLGLEGRVGFTGFVDDVPAAFRALDVVVHASTQPEPFGLVVAEAMACGRAVVASAAGGAAEIVAVGTDALAAPPGDVGALAAAMARLAEDAPLRARLGSAARETARARFDRARMAAEVASLYRELGG